MEIIGQGATTKIYRDGEIALKVYANGPYSAAADEFHRQRFAYEAGLPVPEVFGVRKLDGPSVGLEMAFIDGLPILQPRMDKDDRHRAFEKLVSLQLSVHEVCAEGQPRLGDRLAGRIEHSEHLDGPVKTQLIETLSRLDTGNYLCHGDFHPLNVLKSGEKHWIIDWVDSTAGNPLADACRTYLLLSQFIKRLSGVYLRMYSKAAGVDQEDILRWLPIVAAARLSENIEDRQRAELKKRIP